MKTEFNKCGMLLIPPPKQRSDTFEGMAEKIFWYAAYPSAVSRTRCNGLNAEM